MTAAYRTPLAQDALICYLPTAPGANWPEVCHRIVYENLMEKYQNTDPFKYILYSAKISEETPAMSSK